MPDLLPWMKFAIYSFATWYIAHVLVLSAGPFRVFARLRAHTTLGGLLECTVCLSLWVAVFLIGWTYLVQDWILPTIPAVAGAAVLLDRLTD